MAGPILLVADDLSTIASAKRLLAREGYEVVLATSAADAVIAFGHHLPAVVLLAPGVESDRGQVVLEELKAHPEAGLLRVLLLGETIPGFAYAVAPLPLDSSFVETVNALARGGASSEGWSVPEQPGVGLAPPPAAQPGLELETWRATEPPRVRAEPLDPLPTPPQERRPLEDEVEGELFLSGPQGSDFDPSALPEHVAHATQGGGGPEAAQTAARDFGVSEDTSRGAEDPNAAESTSRAAEDFGAPAGAEDLGAADPPALPEAPKATAPGGGALLGGPAEPTPPALPSLEEELHREVEAEAMRSVDGELQALEDEVRAEAARRRQQRELRPDLPPVAPAVDPAVENSTDADLAALDASFASPRDTPLPEAVEPTEPPGRALAAGSEDALSRYERERREALARETELAREASERDEMAGLADKSLANRQAGAVRAAEALRRAVSIAARARAGLADRTAALSAERAQLQRALENAESLVRTEREARAALEEELAVAREQAVASQAVEGLSAQLAQARKQLAEKEAAFAQQLQAAQQLQQADAAAKLSALQREHAQALEAAAEVQTEVELELEAAAESASALRAELTRLQHNAQQSLTTRAALEERVRRAEEAAAAAERLTQEANDERTGLREALDGAQELTRQRAAQAATLELRLRESEEASSTLMSEVEAARATAQRALEEETSARLTLEAKAHELVLAVGAQQGGRQAAEERIATLEADLEAARAQRNDALRQLEAHDAERATSSQERGRLEAELFTRKAEAERLEARLTDAGDRATVLEAQLEAERHARAAAQERLAEVLPQLDTERQVRSQAQERVLEAEATAAAAAAQVRVLEQRVTLPLSLPDRPPLALRRVDDVDLAGLAHVVTQLCLGKADVKLELGVKEGARTLWLERGQLVAAETTFPHESLVDRARRDGLIDARQENELRLLRTGATVDALELLKSRGALREAEVVPLLQRHAEAIALEALGDAPVTYRISEDGQGPGTVKVTATRPVVALLAEALKRALLPDTLLQQLGGSGAVPVTTDADLEARGFGFSDRERRLLGFVDGQATVEELAMASGLKAEAAFKVLLVGKLLGLLKVEPPKVPAPVPSFNLELERLEAKYDQVQEADYFTILGLTRTAGSDEVQRAFERLGQEFDPIRFSGHPDASVQQRAQVVFKALEEAAAALEDDRRRAEYARHLVD